MEEKENFTSINGSKKMFIVRTGSGFRKAVREYEEYMNVSRGDRENLNVNNPPDKYPCFVTFNWLYCGYHYIHCDWVHLNVMHAALASDVPQRKQPGKLVEFARSINRAIKRRH